MRRPPAKPFLLLLASLLGAAVLAAAGNPATGTPPSGVAAIALDSSVQLAWQPVSGASGYTVYRGTTPTTITSRLTSAAGVAATTYTDSPATNATTFYYLVRAVVSGAESTDSAIVQATPVARSCTSGNPVVLENCFPGTPNWNVRSTAPISAGGIEGYATAQSINKGESLGLKVNADDGSSFRIEIYRSGYYGGAGARLFSTVRSVPGVRQPGCISDAATGLLDCSNWSLSYTLTTTAAWPSGIYLLRLVRLDTGADNQVIFVVRDDASHSDVLYGSSFSTFQAYNNYGGKSLYTFNSSGGTTVAGTPRAVKVSFDRPFEQPRSGLRDWYTKDEDAMVYWLEQEGYDATYVANTDLETAPALVRNHKAYVSPAHDEYISAGMRSALEQARDAGVSLFFSGSNESYWKIRFETSPSTGAAGRVQVCYKTVESGGPDPSGISTSTWRDPAGPNQPENALSGQMYVGDADNTYFPLVVSASQGSDRVYRYTGLDAQAPNTSTSIGQGLIGWEWDARVSNGFEPAGVKTLAGSPVTGNLIQGNGHNQIPGSTTVNVTKYTAPSGALVFNAGTNHWNRGLADNADGVGEPDVRIQQVSTNVLADMGAQPATPAGNIVLDTGVNRPPAPTGVGAVALGTDQVRITWNAVAGATGYVVYRSLTPRDGGLPLGATATPQPVTATTFTDSGLNPATIYYYVVTSIVGGTQSLASAEAAATTPAGAGQPTRINSGGPAYTSPTGATFQADSLVSGGSTFATTHAITGTSDPALFQDERWGQFTYTIPVTNGTYDVRFNFAEVYYGTSAPGGAGKRVFGMDVLNTTASPDLANIDIYAAVGANAAYVRTVSGVQVTNGSLQIRSVYGAADDPEVTSIEVIPISVPPTVTDTAPANGATGVSRLIHPSATFSRAMDATTITPTSFTLTRSGGTAVTGTVAYDAATASATFTPAAALDFSTTYTARLATTVKAADGTALLAAVTWTFTTQAPVPPTVTSTLPAAGATGIAPTTDVDATFSRSLDPTSVTGTSFTLRNAGGTLVPATVAYDDATRTASLSPSSPLALGTTFTATLTTAIKAVDGVALAAQVTWTFTTAASPPPPPTVTGTTPASGSTGVSPTAGITATFSRAMNPADLTATTFTLTGPGGAVTASVSYNVGTRVATITPVATLASSTPYQARLDGSIQALDGTPLGTPVTWTFTTIGPPTVSSTSPLDGSAYVARSAPVTATFSRSMDAASLTSATFTVTGPTGSVPAAVTYVDATRTATLTPSSPLAGGVTYTATVSTGARAADGTALAAPVTWTFSTAACPCSLFSLATTPASSDLPVQDGRSGVGPWSYEFGVKTVVDQPMQLTAIRFYKSTSETGTHIGRVWTAAGTQLASVTFTGESAVGWQEQALPTPLALQPGTTYVVSVNANAFFVVTPGGLASQVVSGPLRSVADGANGVYGATSGSFPSLSFASSNYLVDLLAVPSGDPVPPTVTATSPVSGATGVARTAAITATFSRSMEPSTINSSTFTLTGPGGAVAAGVSYDDGTHTATLTPAAPLAYSTGYTARLSSAVRARDGMPLSAAVQWNFTVTDPVRPQVTGTLPLAGATDVGPSTPVRATFDRALDPATVTGSSFTLTGPSGAVAGSVSYDAATTTAILTPSSSLSVGSSYTATLAASVATPDQATLGTPYSWSFTVASLAAPTVTATTPANGSTLVARDASVTATFSRTMDPTTLTTATVTLTPSGGAAVAATVSYDAPTRTVRLTPSALLSGATTYVARVSTGAKAADGTPLAAAATWSFVTATCPCSLFSQVTAPALVGLSTQDGRTGTGPFTYELGTKLTVDQTTQLSALRFYKSPGETGTHVGRLWSVATNGAATQLTSVTFTGESASGWQQQALASAVTLQPGVVYVVSVNANAFFVVTTSGLASQVVSGPLRSVADGHNGVYAPTAGQFPDQFYSSSNYFVDVVGTPSTISAPSVTSFTPAAGAAGVPRTTTVTASFSRSIDPTTLTSSSFRVTGPGGGAVAGSISYSDTNLTATFTPAAPLAYLAGYTATVTTAVLATDGAPLAAQVQWSFTIADQVRPQVTGTLPPGGTTDVSPSAHPQATFSKSLDPTTVTTSTFTLTGPGGAIAGTVAYDDATKTATFTPAASLATGSYTATLAGTIAGTDQSTLGTPYSWSFSVPSAPAALAVTSSSPTAGATGVLRDATLQATFNRSLDPATLTTTTFRLRAPDASLVSAAVSYNDATKTATLTPAALLTAGATYTVEVTTGLHAVDGTALPAQASWTFTTGPCPCSLFPDSSAPASTGNPARDGRQGAGPFTLELGVKVTVTQASQLSALRFYKDPQETGTHVGRIWTANGTPVASVTFSGESASGWQTQALASPVALAAGTTYVISVNVNANFVVTPGGLASQVTSGPFQSVADGANGVYALTAGSFPSSTWNSTNYFVDGVIR